MFSSLKPGKDPTNPGSYRPISLQLTSNCWQRCWPIASARSSIKWFMKIKWALYPINPLQLISDAFEFTAKLECHWLLSLNAAKAFDSVEWKFLWTVLGRMGFGPPFILFVQLLYAGPTAKIRAGDMLSNSFEMGMGTRQGCPLSPLLFALAVELLACILQTAPTVVGFKCGREEERISLYADDILLYLGDVRSSITPVMTI